jgi:hypothetical protein
VELARRRAEAARVNVRFAAGDLRTLDDLGGPFAFLFDRGCYHAVRRVDVAGYLAAVARWTAPGAVGLVLAGSPRTKEGAGPPVVTEEQLRTELGSVFEIVHVRAFSLDQAPGETEVWPASSCWLRKPLGPEPAAPARARKHAAYSGSPAGNSARPWAS